MARASGATLKHEQVLAEIARMNGNLSAVARALGVARETVAAYVRNHPTAKQALDEARETMLDNAESVLYKKVLEGATPELLFFLKTQGRERGYTERLEHTGRDGADLKILVEYVNFDPDPTQTT